LRNEKNTLLGRVDSIPSERCTSAGNQKEIDEINSIFPDIAGDITETWGETLFPYSSQPENIQILLSCLFQLETQYLNIVWPIVDKYDRTLKKKCLETHYNTYKHVVDTANRQIEEEYDSAQKK